MHCFQKQKPRIESADVKTPEQLFESRFGVEPAPSIVPPAQGFVAGGILG